MKKILISCIFVIAATSLSLIIALGHGGESPKCDINDVYYPNDENCFDGDVPSHNDNGNDNDIENNDNANDDNDEVFDQNDTTTDPQNDNDETDYPQKYQVLATRDHATTQTSTWAKSDTHIFFITSGIYSTTYTKLLSSAIENPTQVNEILTIDSFHHRAIEIVGINENFLFISVIYDSDHSAFNQLRTIYRVCISTFVKEEMFEILSYSVPKLHHTTGSFVFALLCPSSISENSYVTLHSICLDTERQTEIYQFVTEDLSSSASGWLDMEHDALVFVNSSWGALEGDFVLIDPALNAKSVGHMEIDVHNFASHEIESELSEILSQLVSSLWNSDHTIIGDWVYYIRRGGVPHPEFEWIEIVTTSLYKIRTDGTDITNVQEDVLFTSLYSINNTLFAVVRDFYGGYSAEVVLLSLDGEIEKILGAGSDGHNSSLFISGIPGTNLAAIRQGNFFLVDSMIQGIFCTVTGELFTTYDGSIDW